MKNILYVDDVRFPKIWKEEINKVTIARNYEQVLKNLLVYRFDIVDLDHDLRRRKNWL